MSHPLLLCQSLCPDYRQNLGFRTRTATGPDRFQRLSVTIVCAHVSWDSLLRMIVFVQAILVRGQDCLLPNKHLLRILTCLTTRRGMVKRPPGTTGIGLLSRSNTRRTVTLGGTSGPPVGYQSDYEDRSRQSDSTKDNKEAAEVVTVAEVEVVESRDWNHGRAVTENVVGVTQASTACDSTLALATESDIVRSRLGGTPPPHQ